MEEMLKYMRALVYLQVQQLTGAEAFAKPELLLERAGFQHQEIADILGKTKAAVSKTLSRARQAAKENTSA